MPAVAPPARSWALWWGVVAVLVGLLGSLVLVLVASRAAFTTASATGGSLSTGTVAVGDNDAGSALFAVSAARPGNPQSRCVEVSYTGSVASAVRMFTAGSGALADHVDVVVELGSGASAGSGDCTGFVLSGKMFAGTLTQLLARSTFATGLTGFDPAGPAAASYRITWTLNSGAPDTAQGQSATATLTWQARSGVAGAPFTVYALDESSGTTAADSSTNRNPATATAVTWGQGPAPGAATTGGTSVGCNGTTSYVRDTRGYAMSRRDPYTVAVWARMTSLDSYDTIVNRGNLTGVSFSSKRGIALGVSGTYGFYTERYDLTGARDYVNSMSTVVPATGTWYHVAVTYDGATLRLYVNGSAVGSTAATLTVPDNADQPLRVCSENGSQDGVVGRVDDVRVYNRALAAAEVAALAA